MTISQISYFPTDQMTADMRDISTVVLDKNLDTQEIMGESLVKMMEQSVTPELGQNIDLRV